LLGTATGLSYAAVAGLLKEDVGTLGRGMSALFTAWPFYALVAVGALGLLVNQLAYQAGPLSSSLPAIMTVGPIVSVVIGVAVFDEHFRNGPAALLGEAVGLVLVVMAAGGLTRCGLAPAFGAPGRRSDSRASAHCAALREEFDYASPTPAPRPGPSNPESAPSCCRPLR
jgi:hypothetical protein